MLLPCPKCGNGNHISASTCQCGFQLLIGKPQPELQYAETAAASQAAQQEVFPTKSANLIRIPLPQAALESTREMQSQAALEALPLAEESESRKSAKGKSNVNLKRFLVLASFVIVAGALLAMLVGYSKITQGGEPDEKAPISLVEASLAPDSRNLAASDSAHENSIAGRVVDIAGGDTITIADANDQEYKIRLEGIDAPEPEQEFGAESESNLFNLAFGKTVQVNLHKYDADGFTVGRVMLDGDNVSLEQLKAGLAWHDENIVLEQSDKDLYARNETAARSGGLGLWATTNPLPPWEYRSKTNLKQSENQTVAADGNGKTPKVAPNDAPKTEAAVRETSGSTESQTIFTENVSEPAQTKSSTTISVAPPLPPKVSKPVSPVNEPDPIVERKPTPVSRSTTARCGDGTLSFGTTRNGACAGRGGVAQWLDDSPPPAKARKRDENSDSTKRGECFIIKNGKKVYLERGECGN